MTLGLPHHPSQPLPRGSNLRGALLSANTHPATGDVTGIPLSHWLKFPLPLAWEGGELWSPEFWEAVSVTTAAWQQGRNQLGPPRPALGDGIPPAEAATAAVSGNRKPDLPRSGSAAPPQKGSAVGEAGVQPPAGPRMCWSPALSVSQWHLLWACFSCVDPEKRDCPRWPQSSFSFKIRGSY